MTKQGQDVGGSGRREEGRGTSFDLERLGSIRGMGGTGEWKRDGHRAGGKAGGTRKPVRNLLCCRFTGLYRWQATNTFTVVIVPSSGRGTFMEPSTPQPSRTKKNNGFTTPTNALAPATAVADALPIEQGRSRHVVAIAAVLRLLFFRSSTREKQKSITTM